ncbi:MAG: hypothetical protein COU65_01005 [Candidatus Pacebacteria bacterium CG10_big_fil_rev_8_21_14_0_10_42_12]|nr:alpha-glucan family phosphorylase [Candidatus Paceibacterota bacterium]PIR62886.1 MAG: hypothetical protein COU65_01005 [Candidatus Pacebacteria bacterium CG10_big_fil_rev_8_21_14_0_10_42_12]
MTGLPLSPEHPIAYFSAEFGISSAVPIYAGGLGILAGDTLKQAADEKVPMVGVGLMYRGHNVVQEISSEGWQSDKDYLFDPLSVGLEHVYQGDQPLFIKVELGNTTIWLRVWKWVLGPTVTLYFLDSETDQNQLHERSITQELYAGSEELQIKQQLLLSIGGVRLLETLGISPSIYHVNEGRPSFLIWELIVNLQHRYDLNYSQAWELARKKIVYTNHTLVAAGNVNYPADLLRAFITPYAAKLGVHPDILLLPGKNDDSNRFFTTTFALRASRKSSGVSKIHTQLSRQQWPEYDWVSITNGVHFGTWQSESVASRSENPEALWAAHMQEKKQLAEFVTNRTGYSYDPERLVITWARRIAGYKRADAIFADIARLQAIIKNADRPVQLLIAGKAHQLDDDGKKRLQRIIKYMQRELSGSALFVPNYDIDVAKALTRGSDIWLNTPEIGREACGTSGMKALSNGVLNCTVADGWAAEVDWNGKGWVLDSNNISDHLYNTLEREIVPLYYEKEGKSFPSRWVEMMGNSIDYASEFSAARMLNQYQTDLYT